MKYFIQFSKILNSKQKKSFFLLTFLMFISMVFEIFALSILFILLNFLADIPNNQSIILIEKIKNQNFDYPIHLQILIRKIYLMILILIFQKAQLTRTVVTYTIS